ncbi:HAD-IIIC family phosphatase [Aeromonas bivalvium]|uniref:HAD-IIIC family phosphatase n=1 Tax=Aeromonas bivalvium TaxID=440079 RepID=UPI003D2121A3
MKKIILDLDNTISFKCNLEYSDAIPNKKLIEHIKKYRDNGFYIVIFTARNMKTHSGNVGKINIHTLPIIMEWLNKHDVPFDEVIVGKPWCGADGFYVDDRAIRPSEFCSMSFDEINKLLDEEKKCFS